MGMDMLMFEFVNVVFRRSFQISRSSEKVNAAVVSNRFAEGDAVSGCPTAAAFSFPVRFRECSFRFVPGRNRCLGSNSARTGFFCIVAG